MGKAPRAMGTRPRLAGRPTETAGWEASKEEEAPTDIQARSDEMYECGKWNQV